MEEEIVPLSALEDKASPLRLTRLKNDSGTFPNILLYHNTRRFNA